MGIEFKRSASRHGISRDDAVYVMLNATERVPFTDETGRKAMKFTGRLHAQTDRIAEVIANVDGKNITIFHAMETGERASE